MLFHKENHSQWNFVEINMFIKATAPGIKGTVSTK